MTSGSNREHQSISARRRNSPDISDAVIGGARRRTQGASVCRHCFVCPPSSVCVLLERAREVKAGGPVISAGLSSNDQSNDWIWCCLLSESLREYDPAPDVLGKPISKGMHLCRTIDFGNQSTEFEVHRDLRHVELKKCLLATAIHYTAGIPTKQQTTTVGAWSFCEASSCLQKPFSSTPE